jgi:NAD(P)H-quinone oxidoreductase subunit 5
VTLTTFGRLALLLSPTVAALGGAAIARASTSIPSAWRAARWASVAMMIAAAGGLVVVATADDHAGVLVRSDTVGAIMLALVSFIAWVVRRYVWRMLATLAAVTVVVVANNIVLLAAAWAATSLALHELLTFYRERPVAVSVAHKKFLLARCADACMVGAAIAFSVAFDTLRIDQIVAHAAAADALPGASRVGIALVALAALLKCAQLPFHGWLIQVMEAPTPVSALLHAGVVNLGGFVLLRFAPVVDRATETRALLVVVGTATAVIAALVMTTRVSVKVSLAWSTCAQMGFMLMQCGLGAWSVALLHLLAHSLYKAHSFLGAGGTVRQVQRKQLAPARRSPSIGSLAAGAAVAIAATAVAGALWSQVPAAESVTPTLWVLGGIVALSLVALAASPAGDRAPGVLGVRPTTAAAMVAVPFAYFALHDLFGQFAPHGADAPVALLAFVAGGFALLFAAQAFIAVAPEHRIVRRAYPWIYGGLFLDEAFTRAAFAVWAPPAPRPIAPTLARPSSMPVIEHESVGVPA